MEDQPTRTPRAGNRWIEAVDAQLDLIRFWRSDQGRLYGQGFTEYKSDYVESGNGGLEFPITDEMKRDGLTQGDALAIREYWAIKNAPTYWVSRELGYVIDKAAKTLPKEPLSPRELPTASGFVFLERPIYVKDIRGDMVGIKLFRWNPTTVTIQAKGDARVHTRCLHVSWYGDVHDPDDQSLARMKEGHPRAFEGLPRWSLWHQDMWLWAAMDDDNRAALLSDDDPVSVKGNVRLHSDDRWAEQRNVTDVDGLIPDASENSWLWIPGDDGVATWMNAFFRFCSQDITKISRGHLPRALQHRIKRAKMPEWGDVRIIDLRRVHYVDQKTGEADEEAWLRWTHRWEVNGYWRRQWVGSDDPTSAAHKEHGPRHWIWKWIDGHVKGPEYLPLIAKDDIRRVTR